MNSSRGLPGLVLFDLDGTLLDTAPDFQATIDDMRAARRLSPLPLLALRPQVSRGTQAMLAGAFPDLDPAAREALVPEFLNRYARHSGRHGGPFPGVAELLEMIEAAGSRWGIVTNKPVLLASRLLPMFGWQRRCALLLGGDSLPERKPHPLPLLHAAECLQTAIIDCVYVGDDARDIQAARAAGMPSVAALWGYRPVDDDPRRWGADALAAQPARLLDPDAWP